LERKEKYLVLAAIGVVALDFTVPYTIAKETGAFAFWVGLALLTLALGYFFTKSWGKNETRRGI